MSDNKKPAAKINLPSGISCAVWRTENERGVFYSATLQKRYRDAAGDWKSTDFLSETETLLGAKALEMAFAEMVKLRSNDRNAQPEDQAA